MRPKKAQLPRQGRAIWSMSVPKTLTLMRSQLFKPPESYIHIVFSFQLPALSLLVCGLQISFLFLYCIFFSFLLFCRIIIIVKAMMLKTTYFMRELCPCDYKTTNGSFWAFTSLLFFLFKKTIILYLDCIFSNRVSKLHSTFHS